VQEAAVSSSYKTNRTQQITHFQRFRFLGTVF
jgi:hypothetical protein